MTIQPAPKPTPVTGLDQLKAGKGMAYLFSLLTSLLLLGAQVQAHAQSQAMTVQATDIANKTSLIAVSSVKVNGKTENILTDDKGISLYTFELDTANISNCSGKCLKEWPPEHVPAGANPATPFGTINGNDGQPQLTLNGAPLYHYDDDQKPGDAFGQYPKWDAIIVQ